MNKKKLILIAEVDVSIRTVLSNELENNYDLKILNHSNFISPILLSNETYSSKTVMKLKNDF